MATELTTVPPLEVRALSLTEKAQAVVVRDQETHDAAAEMYLGLSALLKEIDSVHDPAISAAYASHKAALAAKDKLAGPVEKARKIVKPKITAWEEEQRRIREELQRKAEEEARRLREEQERIQREEQRRLEAEARKAAEEERLRLALEFEAMGRKEEADAILAEPIPEPEIESPPLPPPIMAPVVAPTFQKTSGFSSRTNYSAQVVNMRVLCRAIADGKASVNLVQAAPALNQLARTMKELFNVPGCWLRKELV